MMTHDQACEVLGLGKRPFEEWDVKDAWRKAVKAAHPDLGGDGDIGRLNAAREVLLQPYGQCEFCSGTGVVRSSRWGFTDCTQCDGTGLTS